MRRFGWIGVLVMVAGCGGPVTSSDAGRTDGQVRPDGGSDAGVTVCERLTDCNDGVFCNGEESCMPGAPGAGANGCVPGTAPCDTSEICNESEGRCDADACSDGGDADGDGDARSACGGNDCDDGDPRVYSTAQEVCDAAGLDEDCDPSTIQDETLEDGDTDHDGFVAVGCFNTRADGSENRGTDCDDTRPTVNPSGVEACNGRDDDCNGMIDEGVQVTFYRDIDGDGYGVSTDTDVGCTAPLGYVLASGDCADGDRNINPAASETCNAIDDNCDGAVDPGCDCTSGATRACGIETGECTVGTQTCLGGIWGDCPGRGRATETCNGLDDDCDGMTDEGLLSTFWRDADMDGFGNPAMPTMACTAPAGYVDNSGDCDDSTAAAAPTNVESSYPCDGLDNDCDRAIDEAGNDTVPCFRDTDGDGWGGGSSAQYCSCPAGWVASGGDCRDDLPSVNPGATAYSATPYCSGGYFPCTRFDGSTGCRTSMTVCGPAGRTWDYDCSGASDPQSSSCSLRCSGGLCTCTGGRLPTTAHTASECGTNVTYADCCGTGSCSRCSAASEPLRCR